MGILHYLVKGSYFTNGFLEKCVSDTLLWCFREIEVTYSGLDQVPLLAKELTSIEFIFGFENEAEDTESNFCLLFLISLHILSFTVLDGFARSIIKFCFTQYSPDALFRFCQNYIIFHFFVCFYWPLLSIIIHLLLAI